MQEGWAGRPRPPKLAGGMKGGTIRVKGWPQYSPHVQGSESAGECGEGVCTEGVCSVNSIDVAAPGRG